MNVGFAGHGFIILTGERVGGTLLNRNPGENSLQGHEAKAGGIQLASPARTGLQKHLVAQGGLVGDIKCDYEGALGEDRRNEDKEGHGRI